MKKILLLIVSGLLIACMGGSAMAVGSNIYDITGTIALSDINVTAGGAGTHFSYGINTLGEYNNAQFYYNNIGPGNQIEAEVTPLNGGASSDITVEYIDHISFFANSDPYVDVDNLLITAAPGTSGKNYSVEIPVYINGDVMGTLTFISKASASADVHSIPEFPTIAAPIAGILGLLFIFGRKKEGQ